MKRRGYYTDLSEDKQGNLVITRTTNVWRERGRFLNVLTSSHALRELLEDHLCNGLEWVHPEDVGALTDSPILGEDPVYNDEGELTGIGKTWWFPDYCMRNEVEEIIKKGRVVFTLAE